MTSRTEQDQIRAEVESVLRDHGIPKPEPSQQNTSDLALLREIALRIIRGHVDRSEISDLGEDAAAELADMVQNLISLRNSPTIQDLEASNPYYTVSQSEVIRDDAEIAD
jgi:hypothetical protein